MARFRYDNKIKLLIILASILLILLCLSVIAWFRTGEEASVGIFSLAVTLLGTMFIAVELKNGQDVTCSDMLIDLNNYFHDSDRLMKVYDVLERHETAPDACRELWKDVRSVEVAHYCTFFENLYLLYRHHIAEIEDLDDLFGYRFFIFVNNPYIQENYILPTSSSYVQIFKLYDAWTAHRRHKGGPDWRNRIPFSKYMFSPEYLKDRLYLNDLSMKEPDGPVTFESKGKQFTLRDLTFENLSEILDLQRQCTDALPDPDIYYPLSRNELLESLHLDIVPGIFAPDGRLVAVAAIVIGRVGDRNLAESSDDEKKTSFTFDAVFVAPDWRGYGLQRILIDRAAEKAREAGAKQILATVSPDNRHSLANFTSAGYEITATVSKYGGLTRNILRYDLTAR